MIYGTKKGDLITCENGHIIAKLNKDIEINEGPTWVEKLTFIGVKKPQLGSQGVQRCHYGFLWCRDGVVLHTKEGWMDEVISRIKNT